MALVGVTALAKALGRSKSTVSELAAAGRIPVAERTAGGDPLFDVDQVKAAYEPGINPMMRRRGDAVAPGAGPEPDADDDERRSLAGAERLPSGLQQQLILERRLRNQRLAAQLAVDQGALVPKAVVDNDVMTLARQTRDNVSAQLADYAGKLYAFISSARSEGELRVWLAAHVGLAFDETERGLAAEKGDEFGDADDSGQLQPANAEAAA